MRIERCFSKTERRGERVNPEKNGGRGTTRHRVGLSMMPIDFV